MYSKHDMDVIHCNNYPIELIESSTTKYPETSSADSSFEILKAFPAFFAEYINI